MSVDKKKEFGQYITPDGIVNMILDSVGFIGKKTISKSIMEPSFGDGAFLVNIITRIILEAKIEGMDSESIAHILNNHVYGIELDSDLYHKAISKINHLLMVYDIPAINWDNLINGDTLLLYKDYEKTFDFVVGNPPFVRIHNIPEHLRETVKNFSFSNGMIDMYIVFYEIGLEMLNDNGRLGYISPNSFMKNTSQAKFRDYLIKRKYISAIYDFKTSKIFPDAGTYTCICVLDKNIKRVDFSVDYKEYSMYEIVAENRFSYNYFKKELEGKAWNLSSGNDIRFLEENKRYPIKIGNVAIVQNGVATNKDSVYVHSVFEDKSCAIPYMGLHSDPKKIVYFIDSDSKAVSIESTILHRCVKASKYDGIMKNTYIIFPYKSPKTPKFFDQSGNVVDSGYEPYTESELKSKFPYAYQYLLSVWDELSARDMDKHSDWFLFGRSQGLQNSAYKKIVFKHIIDKGNPTIKPYIVDGDVIVYSGMYTTIDTNICISPKIKNNGEKDPGKYIFNESSYDFELKEISQIFESEDFSRYCTIVGKDMSGGYVGISTKMVKAFGTRLTTFPNFPVEIPEKDFCIADNNYMNNLFHQKFVECIKLSHIEMGKYGKTSSKRVEPFHSFLAKVLQYKLGTDYDIRALGYSYGKELSLGGNFDDKNVDVCILKDHVPIGAIAFKLLANNFKQNNKNFIESMLGEAVQMRDRKLPYAFCYLIPEVALHLGKGDRIQPFNGIDRFTQSDLKVYYDIMVDESYKGRTPDALFVGMHKLFDKTYINSLQIGSNINLIDPDYLNAIQPEWSDYSFVSDETIRDYFLERNNIGKFLDDFIEICKN